MYHLFECHCSALVNNFQMLNLIFIFRYKSWVDPTTPTLVCTTFFSYKKLKLLNLTYFISSSDYCPGGLVLKGINHHSKDKLVLKSLSALVVVVWRWGCSSPTIITTLLIPLVRQVGSKIYKAHVVDFQTQHLRLIHHTVPQRVVETSRKLG